jgi:heat shock protein HslJ
MLMVTFSGCGDDGGGETASEVTQTDDTAGDTSADATVAGITAPVTFHGARICADCPGAEITLTLREDGLYFLRHTRGNPAEGGERAYASGRWMLDAGGHRLVLDTDGATPLELALVADGQLRILGPDGTPTPINDIEELAANGQLDMFDEAMPLEGVYRYMADAGLMTLCSASRWFPVVQEDANAALERAYLRAQASPGAPVMVAFEGYLDRRPRMEGDGEEDVVVVTRFDRVVPGEPCGKPADSPLENTYWRLAEVDHQLVRTPADAKEAHMKLRNGTVEGFGGCNGITTTYEREGRRLVFAPFATTMMYCEGRSEIETAFHRALGDHTRFKISGETLELFKGDALIARFQAMYFE